MIFVDMDGTLNFFEQESSIEEITSKGYFRSRKPIPKVVAAIRYLADKIPNEVCILSSVFQDDHSASEKQEWLKEYLPEVRQAVFVPYGMKKSGYIEQFLDRKLTCQDYLIDDFSKNLHEWTGIGIKLYNDINGTKGTWNGYSVHYNCSPEIIVNTILGIMAMEKMEKEK